MSEKRGLLMPDVGRATTHSISALIFDLDGLLVDSEPASESAMRMFLHSHGQEPSPTTFEGTLGRRLPEAIAVVAEAHSLTGKLSDLIAVFDLLRLEALRGAVVAMPGAHDVLDWAAANGLPCALATSSYRHHADVALAETGLAGRFTVEVTGVEAPRGKPEPDLFLLAARRLEVDPASCLVFEDAPAGLEAAARAGMQRVWVPNTHTRRQIPTVTVDAVLDSLAKAGAWMESQGIAFAASPMPRARVRTTSKMTPTTLT